MPFTARVEQTLNDAVRFAAEGRTPRVPGAGCCANVAVSPDGKRVAYSALGQLYIKELPGGTTAAR